MLEVVVFYLFSEYSIEGNFWTLVHLLLIKTIGYNKRYRLESLENILHFLKEFILASEWITCMLFEAGVVSFGSQSGHNSRVGCVVVGLNKEEAQAICSFNHQARMIKMMLVMMITDQADADLYDVRHQHHHHHHLFYH